MILESFDDEQKALINPENAIDMDALYGKLPKIAVTCFSKRTFERMLSIFHAELIEDGSLGCANDRLPLYRARYNNLEFLLFMSAVGAPVCVATLDELQVLGVEKFVVFGTCGVLDSSIKDLSIIIPTSAVRAEGTSYHYQPASDEIDVNEKYQGLCVSFLKEQGISYTLGKVWTTDAFYRETARIVEARKKQGCIAVDMECSAIAAFAKFRGVDVFHFFYAADNLDAEEWDVRSLANHDKLEEKDRIAYLAIAFAKRIAAE